MDGITGIIHIREVAIADAEDLKPGGYVVHAHHGVGRYEGMVKRTIGGIERDYLLLAYKGGDKLYVPSDQIDALRQYVGGEAPVLHRLGGADFAKANGIVIAAANVSIQANVACRGVGQASMVEINKPFSSPISQLVPLPTTVSAKSCLPGLAG